MSTAPRLTVSFFDGRSARARTAEIWLDEERRELLVQSAELQRYATRQVRWPERQRYGERQVLLPDGGVLSTADSAAWNAWAAAAGLQDTLLVRWMQSWRHVALACVLLAAALGAGWRWGVPAAAEAVLALISPEVEAQVGERSLDYLDDGILFRPSNLSPERQREIQQRFARAAARAVPATGPQPAWRLHLRHAGKALGPNAFALPGGDIVLTDELVELLKDEPDAIVGILAHELGHVKYRHGMRMAIQAGITAAVAGAVVGDFSAVLAGAPAVLAQAAYSRDFERQADAYSRQLMLGAGIHPEVMVTFFERIAKRRGETVMPLPIAISSHPADAERIRFFGGGAGNAGNGGGER